MNQKFSAKAIQRGFWMGAMILSAVAASAATQVTFQVDMTAQVTAGTFTNGTAVTAAGTFNGWGQFPLTNNPAAANPNLYTGTTNDTSDAIPGVLSYKYVTNNGTGLGWEGTADGDNRCAQLPTNGASLLLPVSFFDDAGPSITVNVTFQVDMAEQVFLGNFDTNNGAYVEVRGSFNGWSAGNTLTNIPTIMTTNAAGLVTSNVYVGTFAITGSTNGTQEYKYVMQPGTTWESPASSDSDPASGNRFFINENEALPIVAFDDLPYVKIIDTNNVTFEVDMTTQIESGNFATNANTVEIHGDFNGWASGQTMTNNPLSSTPNIFSTVIEYTGAPNTQRYFKYVIQPGTQWETISAANEIGGNRWFDITNSANTNVTVGPVYFSDEAPSALIDFVTVTNCMVTFTVNMTNGTGTGPGGSATFDNAYPSGDAIYINGLNNGVNNSFWTWGGLGDPTYQMTQIPNTFLFTITVPVNPGQNDLLVYKYSINGNDDEAASGDNHERWIRSLPNYTMPVDTYASQGSANQVESPAGNLTATAVPGNKVQLTWLGRRGVLLETANSLSPGTVWTPLPLTDGTNLIVAPGGMATTNYTIGQTNVFYQLVGPH
jgi:hypothetical protein